MGVQMRLRKQPKVTIHYEILRQFEDCDPESWEGVFVSKSQAEKRLLKLQKDCPDASWILVKVTTEVTEGLQGAEQ